MITKQLKAGGVKIPLMGGDGMFSDTYIKTAGKASEGDLATSVGVPVTTLPVRRRLHQEVQGQGLPGDYGTYGGYSYDAATAIIKAIGTSSQRTARSPIRRPRQDRRRRPEDRLRRHRRPRLLRRVRRHHQQAAHRLPGRRRQVEGRQERHATTADPHPGPPGGSVTEGRAGRSTTGPRGPSTPQGRAAMTTRHRAARFIALLTSPQRHGGHAVHTLPQQLANGLFLGSMYGLIAIGYTMVYGIVQLINFAHGEIFMTGGFGALTVYLYVLPNGTSMWIALPRDADRRRHRLRPHRHRRRTLRLPTTARRTTPRPAHHRHRPLPRPPAGRLQLVPERQERRSSFPQLPGGPFHIGSISIQSGDIFLIIAAPLCMAALALFVRTSRTGRAMQATAQDPDTAQLMGIDTNRIIVIAFAIGGFFAAVAGRRLRPASTARSSTTWASRRASRPSPRPSSAASATSTAPCSAASSSASPRPWPPPTSTNIPGMQQLGGGGWSTVWAFVLLILVLLFRPQGLLGERVADRA